MTLFAGFGLLTVRIVIAFSLLVLIYAFLWSLSKFKIYRKLSKAEESMEKEEYIEYKEKVIRRNKKLLFISAIIIFLLPVLIGAGLFYLTYMQNL